MALMAWRRAFLRRGLGKLLDGIAVDDVNV